MVDRGKNGLIRKVDSIQFHVSNIDAGLDFYRDRLGHEVIWRTEHQVGLRMPDGMSEIVLQTAREEPETDLMVESVSDAVAVLLSGGGRLVVSPFEIQIGKCAVIDDPWGNRLVLVDSTKGTLKTDEGGRVIGNERG